MLLSSPQAPHGRRAAILIAEAVAFTALPLAAACQTTPAAHSG